MTSSQHAGAHYRPRPDIPIFYWTRKRTDRGSSALSMRATAQSRAGDRCPVSGIPRGWRYEFLNTALLDLEALEHALVSVEAIIDTSQSPSLEEQEATEFFQQAAANLGGAANRAGVRRTVVLSIVGADRSPDYGYYVAKVKQEQAVREHAPGPVILRATQFHEFAGQMLDMSRTGDTAAIMDVYSQPVAIEEIARLLLDLATGAEAFPADGLIELAGPQRERLVDQVRQLIAHQHEQVTITSAEAPASMANGSMLPGPTARLRGPTYTQWLAKQPKR